MSDENIQKKEDGPDRSVSNNQNNYMEGPGSATINIAAHPKHPEEKETSPNRNHIITSKRSQKN